MRVARVSSVIAFLATAAVAHVGCSDASDDEQVSTSSTGGAATTATTSTTSGAGGAGIDWQPCALVTDGAGTEAECAAIPVPADYAAPHGPTVTFSVKRVLATEQPARGQVWFMNGGPGGSVVDFEPLVDYLHGFDPSFDWYMPEHRGVGLSSRLSCPVEEDPASDGGYSVTLAEMPACIESLQSQWGASLAGFTSENAARDLGETIAATRAPGEDVFVYGISYGSHWGNRYLQLYPDQATGVTLAALAANASFAGIDVLYDQLGERWLDACGADAFCSSKLGADPWGAMTSLMASLDQGQCPEAVALGVDRAFVRAFSAQLLYGWDDRTIIPPLVYRLARCNTADVHAFEQLAAVLDASATGPLTASERNASLLLGDHVGLSEMWTEPSPDLASLEAFVAQANVAVGASTELGAIHDLWPRYTPNPAYAGKIASTSIPILLQQGELDFLTSAVYQPLVDGLAGPNQTFVLYPRATHDPSTGVTTIGESCALRNFYDFILDPTAPVDTSCTADIVPLDFTVNADYALAYFGTIDAWEGDPGTVRLQATSERAELSAAHALRKTMRVLGKPPPD